MAGKMINGVDQWTINNIPQMPHRGIDGAYHNVPTRPVGRCPSSGKLAKRD